MNPALYAQATGGVQGTVKDDAGNALTNVSVFLTTNDPNANVPPATTDNTGSFSFSGVKPGNYTICLFDSGNKHLDPCAWSSGTKVIVKPNQTATDNIVTAVAAATLQVRVDDPQQLLDPQSGVGVPLVAVILPQGGLAPMNVVTVDAGGRTFQGPVPPGSHKLLIRSSTLKIADGTGQDLDGAASTNGQINVVPVNAPVSVTSGMSYVGVTITGKR